MASFSDRLKSIFTLVSGTAFSQAISICATFVLARIYLPSDFGVFGTSFAICTICATFASLKFELTSIFPKRHITAQIYVTFSFLITLVISFCIWGVFELLNRSEIFLFSYSVFTFPLLILLITTEQIVVNWLVRLKKFKLVAIFAIFKTGSIALSQYFLSSKDGGLWYGYLFGFSLTSIIYFCIIYTPLKNSISKIKLRRFIVFVRKNRKFPLYSLPAAAFSTIGAQLPILIIRALFGDQYAGYYLMINRIINAPTMLISRNVHKVVSQEIAQGITWKKKIGHIVQYYIKLMLFLAGLVGSAIIAFTYFDGFTMLLGENWQPIGKICLILLPLALVGFVAKSISRFAVYGKNEWGLYYQFIMVSACLLSFYGSYWFSSDFYFVLNVYSVVISAIYFSQIVLVRLISKELDAKVLPNGTH